MAGKNIKLLGNTGQTKEYWQNAAKQIEWPVDYDEFHISVPADEITRAEQHLMVQHFTNNGFFIQAAMVLNKTKVFQPEPLKGPMFKPLKEVVTTEPLYKQGQKFKVLSTECELQITLIDKGKIHMKYTNRNKFPIITSEQNLSDVLRREQWIFI